MSIYMLSVFFKHAGSENIAVSEYSRSIMKYIIFKFDNNNTDNAAKFCQFKFRNDNLNSTELQIEYKNER